MLELQQDLSYKEHPVRILDQAERRTRQKAIKFLKVQWSHHSEDEATWEREDRLRDDLNLGTRFLVVEEICNARIIMLQ